MKSVFPTVDVVFIKGILERENIYNSVCYDGSPSLEEYVLKGVWLVLCKNEAITGMINLQALNNVMWTPHIFIFEKYRGKGSEEWGIQAALWARENLGAKKLLAFTPYIAAKKYAEKMGFEYLTTLKNSIQKNGKLMNQYMLELGDKS